VIVVLLMGATTVSENLIISGSQGGGGILLPDRDASSNWRMAGMLSVGSIPNRIAVCATVSPLGVGQDDTVNIQNAINNCPLGQVLSLGWN
jgi:hypothetical protein